MMKGDQDYTRTDLIILIVGFGSAFFVIIPYMVNLIVAVRIKKYIKSNEAANSWYVTIG